MNKLIENPFITTVRGLKISSGAKTREVVKKIEEKIMFYGLCSDDEQKFIEQFSNQKSSKR